MQRWLGRVAIVTGAGAGIGASIVRHLAENGMKVVAVVRDLSRMQVLSGELKDCKGEVHTIQGDVTKEEDVVRVVKWTRENLDGADVLVNNAGIYLTFNLTDADAEKIRKIMDVNVLGLCLFNREVIKDMRGRNVDDGHLFNISSVAGHSIMDIKGQSIYTSSKHSVRVLTEGLRRELRDLLGSKIKIPSISPGLVRTSVFAATGLSPEMAEHVFRTNPFLEPVDVANALLYALGTPPHVQVHELTIRPIGELH